MLLQALGKRVVVAWPAQGEGVAVALDPMAATPRTGMQPMLNHEDGQFGRGLGSGNRCTRAIGRHLRRGAPRLKHLKSPASPAATASRQSALEYDVAQAARLDSLTC